MLCVRRETPRPKDARDDPEHRAAVEIERSIQDGFDLVAAQLHFAGTLFIRMRSW
jgi:hypothetical protein